MRNTIMNLPPLKPGHWWVNVAPIGSDPEWIEKPMPDPVDPNKETIFGYDKDEFMARQYRK